MRDRIAGGATPASWACVAAGALGAVLSLAVFYGRYVPIFVDMQRGVPMPEEQILLEKLSSARLPAGRGAGAAGAGRSRTRARPSIRGAGCARRPGACTSSTACFAPVVIAGVVLRLAGASRRRGRVRRGLGARRTSLLNLLSGGLPGPNLVRYNKDLEVVAPLFCLALARVGEWLWTRSARPGGALRGRLRDVRPDARACAT